VSIIEFRDGRYFAKMWFAHADGFDVLAALWHDPGERWTCTWRLRYYTSNDRLDGDKKTAFQGQMTDDCDEKTALARTSPVFLAMVDDFAKRFGLQMTLHEVPLRSDNVETLIAVLQQQEWAHMFVGSPPP
jgi:hypothetical protein